MVAHMNIPSLDSTANLPSTLSKPIITNVLKEELGFDCPLQNLFTLRYKSSVGNNLIENEYDHIYKGIYDGNIEANEEEVMEYEFVAMEELKKRINTAPQEFTEWFKLAIPKIAN